MKLDYNNCQDLLKVLRDAATRKTFMNRGKTATLEYLLSNNFIVAPEIEGDVWRITQEGIELAKLANEIIVLERKKNARKKKK